MPSELGVDHYLGKPFSEEELMSLVRHYCAAETVALRLGNKQQNQAVAQAGRW